MENVVLTVHLILAALLIGVVLLQRSEGGGLGLGGGSGVMTGRQAANALSRATWMLATGFLVTSIALTVIAARNSAGGSVLDRLGGRVSAPTNTDSNLPQLPSYAPPPGSGQPVLPPGAAAPATSAPATTAPVAPAPSPVQPAPAAPSTPAETTPAPAAATTGGTTTTVTVPITPPAPTN